MVTSGAGSVPIQLYLPTHKGECHVTSMCCKIVFWVPPQLFKNVKTILSHTKRTPGGWALQADGNSVTCECSDRTCPLCDQQYVLRVCMCDMGLRNLVRLDRMHPASRPLCPALLWPVTDITCRLGLQAVKCRQSQHTLGSLTRSDLVSLPCQHEQEGVWPI